jgi:hypothetical protein
MGFKPDGKGYDMADRFDDMKKMPDVSACLCRLNEPHR